MIKLVIIIHKYIYNKYILYLKYIERFYIVYAHYELFINLGREIYISEHGSR